MSQSVDQKTVILGASRGLGAAIAEHCLMSGTSPSNLLLVSRKKPESSDLSKASWFSFDLSSDDKSHLISELEAFAPSRVIYVAGGGPFGEFAKSKWNAHEWSFQVSFLTPSKLLHWFMSRNGAKETDQFVVVGSSVAEDKPDPKASSYAASKHALLGLYQSIQGEKPPVDFRLFSPGYMNTDMVPQGSWPRQQKHDLWEPKQVAGILWSWCCDAGQAGGHMSLGQFAETPRNAH